MFEMIGAVVSFVVLLVLAGVVGSALAFPAWLLLRRRDAPAVPLSLCIFVASLLSAGYWTICTIALPGQSFFGDIDEKLPNGYHITALGKIPDYGQIKCQACDPGSPGSAIPGWVSRLQVDGQLVYGEYRPFSSTSEESNGYFAWNTASNKVSEYKSMKELNTFAGKEVQLTELQFFHNLDPAQVHRFNIEGLIEYLPPAILLGGLLVVVAWYRIKAPPLPFR